MLAEELAKSYHYVLDSCDGEFCNMCGTPASHKVEEVIECFDKAGQIVRHPLVAYLCCKHFGEVMGLWAKEVCDFITK